MKYKVKIVKQPKSYQMGGGMQSDDAQSQIIQLIQAYAQANGVDPQQIVQQLQQMGEEEQKQTIMQMYQELQSQEGGDMGYDMQTAAYGGQMGYGLDLGARRLWMNQDTDEELDVNNTLSAVPREYANIEAEGGETAVIPEEDGTKSHYNIKGKRHTQGGVPLNVPEGTFIFSDTKKMKLGGSVLSVFGKSEKSSKKYTPAKLAKQYDLNKYKAILEDPRADAIKKRTAELMIQNYNKKLAQLALVQEGKKGYPQGIPNIAQEYYAKMMQASDVESQEQMEENPQEAMYGGGMMYGGRMKYGGFYKYQNGSQNNEPSKINIAEDFMEPGPNVEMEKPRKPFEFNDIYGTTFKQAESRSLDPNTAPKKDLMQKGVIEYEPNIINEEEDGNEQAYNITTYNRSPIKYGWTNPDKLNLLNSMINMAGVRKFDPFEPTMKFQRPEVSFLDPNRALAANAEQMNAARQAASMFAGPQSRYSFNAGQYGKNAADIIGQYANKNVVIGNQAAEQAANTANQQAQFDAQRAKRLYDAGVIGEQQYQNAMRQARTGVLQAYTQGQRNAADLYNMSMTESPYYGVRPGTGTIYFHSPKSMQGFFNSQSDTGKMSAKDIAQAAKDANMNVSEYLDYMKMKQEQEMMNYQTKGRRSRS
jgi:hypothetical protein